MAAADQWQVQHQCMLQLPAQHQLSIASPTQSHKTNVSERKSEHEFNTATMACLAEPMSLTLGGELLHSSTHKSGSDAEGAISDGAVLHGFMEPAERGRDNEMEDVNNMQAGPIAEVHAPDDHVTGIDVAAGACSSRQTTLISVRRYQEQFEHIVDDEEQCKEKLANLIAMEKKYKNHPYLQALMILEGWLYTLLHEHFEEKKSGDNRACGSWKDEVRKLPFHGYSTVCTRIRRYKQWLRCPGIEFEHPGSTLLISKQMEHLSKINNDANISEIALVRSVTPPVNHTPSQLPVPGLFVCDSPRPLLQSPRVDLGYGYSDQTALNSPPRSASSPMPHAHYAWPAFSSLSSLPANDAQHLGSADPDVDMNFEHFET